MTSINSLPQKRAASVGTLLKNSRKRAPGALMPRGIIRGAQGPRVQLPNGLHAPRRRPTSVLTTRKRCSTVSCTEGRRYAGGELPRNWVGTERARSSPRCPGAQRGHEQRNLCSGHWFEELTKTVVESGILVEAGDRYALTGPVAPLSIPS